MASVRARLRTRTASAAFHAHKAMAAATNVHSTFGFSRIEGRKPRPATPNANASGKRSALFTTVVEPPPGLYPLWLLRGTTEDRDCVAERLHSGRRSLYQELDASHGNPDRFFQPEHASCLGYGLT